MQGAIRRLQAPRPRDRQAAFAKPARSPAGPASLRACRMPAPDRQPAADFAGRNAPRVREDFYHRRGAPAAEGPRPDLGRRSARALAQRRLRRSCAAADAGDATQVRQERDAPWTTVTTDD